MNQDNEKKLEETVPEKKPNEMGGFYFSSSVKIFDPETNQILLQKRGDN